MIDTLKLAKRLTAAHMPAEQAEALSEGLAEGLKESAVSREYFDTRRAEDRAYVDSRRAEDRAYVDAEFRLLKWMIGGVYAILIVFGVPALILLMRLAAKAGALG